MTELKDNYKREYTENDGKTQVKEEGYTQVEKIENGGKKTTTFEQRTYVTKYVDDSQFQNDIYGSSVRESHWNQ